MRSPSASEFALALAAYLVITILLAGAGCLDRGSKEGGPLQSGEESEEADAFRMEVSGLVANVVDGDTFDVEGFGRVRLADVDSPEMDTPGGKAARFFAETMLLGETVYLDVDDLGGMDRYGRWICVAYIEDPETGSLVNFNSILVASGHAEVKDFQDNEFDPADWSQSSADERPPDQTGTRSR